MAVHLLKTFAEAKHTCPIRQNFLLLLIDGSIYESTNSTVSHSSAGDEDGLKKKE